jgi:hypothetical protein
MEKLNEEQKLLRYIRLSREICQGSRNCEACPSKNDTLYLSDISDLFGCRRANNLTAMAEDYQRRFRGSENLDEALITLTGYSKLEGIISHAPNRDGVLGTFERLEAILSQNIEDKTDEIEMLPKIPERYHALRISRKIAQLI